LKFRARIQVRLKSQEFDPEAETVNRSLIDLGFPVSETKVAKIYELVLESKTKKQAEQIAISICKRLLANPTKDDYNVSVEQIDAN
jgi:phosphoribosylformylglycinamidine synthase subunit PurS